MTRSRFERGRFNRGTFANAFGTGWDRYKYGWYRRHPHHHGFFGYRFGWWGWGGPVFWPYAFGDVFSYALWPTYYDDPFWGYDTVGIYDDVFWDYGEPAVVYGGGGDGAYGGGGDGGGGAKTGRGRRPRAGEASLAVQPAPGDICTGYAPGVTDLPIGRFEKAIKPDEGQRQLLADLRKASQDAAERLKQACPQDVPTTPLARLDAMKDRLQALEDAIQLVQDPLERFYSSLSDDQRRRLDNIAMTSASRRGRGREASIGEVCERGSASFVNAPTDRIERAVSNLSEDQRKGLDRLREAAVSGADILKDSCPRQLSGSPAERLSAIQRRIDALLKALDAIRPTVADFYGSLDEAQKAKFDAVKQSSAG